MHTLAIIGLSIACSCVSVFTQQPSGQARAEAIAANFNKHKDVVKEKRGVVTKKYLDVRNEPVVKHNNRDYAGEYQAGDLGHLINIQVGTDGSIRGNGSENGQRTFRLENARIEGALLTGSKVYQDGATEKFEGVFLNRTVRNSPTDSGVTTFGLGVVLNTPFEQHGITWDKLFYKRQ